MSQKADREQFSGFELAIVGMAGRFPGARDVAAFWDNLRAGVESVTFPSEAELLAAGEDASSLSDPRYVRAASVLDGIDLFDAAFFGITPREAELMDPQQRLFLEYAWSALEDAGYDPARCPGPVGVYGGASTNTYLFNNLLSGGRLDASSLSALFGNQSDYLTTRVSYKLNLRGPSLDVQTSCSSSLVAVHLAGQALLAGECDLALAGGSAVVVPQGRGYLYQEEGIYSPDGHCRAFSEDARGTVGGSGVAVVALRRLQDALADGDCIRAVIKGSAINNDGSGKVGYAAPSVEGQTRVIRDALSMADVHPDSIGYVETHGTGTSLGDPIEVAALSAAFRAQTDRRGFCAIGSVKTNIGHLDAAAGVTGLIKASLALSNRELPPSLNCDRPDPKIDFPSTPFHVNTQLTDWAADGPRRAGVSSFGIGGTNAHVVMEEAPATTSSDSRPAQLFVLSARTPTALDQATENLAGHLRDHPEVDLADVAHTLAVGRREFDHRRTIVARDATELAEALAEADPGRVRTSFEDGEDRQVVFLFPGQGAQYVDMARDLYEQEPSFRADVDHAAGLLEAQLGINLCALLFPSDSERAAAEEQLGQTRITQPALFVIEYALARLWMSWGVRPAAMIGHSIGDYVAAALAGVFSLEDALTLVAARGQLMQDQPVGAMLAVALSPAEVEPLLGEDLSLAAVNEPGSCVASGPVEAIEALRAQLDARSVASRQLHTSHAFHSAMMDPILEAFTERVRSVDRKAPALPFISTLTGTWIRDEEATDPEYWARHLRHTVRFAAGIEQLLSEPGRVFVEVGPGNTLTTLARRMGRGQGDFVSSLRHPRETRPDHDCLLDALGQVWRARVAIDWQGFRGDEQRRRVPLPTYPFERERFWIEPGESGAVPDTGKRPDVADWFYAPSWRRAARVAPPDAPKADRFLILADRGGLAAEVGAQLTALGKSVSVIDAADTLEALDGALPEVVLHLGGADPGDGDALDRGLFSLLGLAQKIGERAAQQPLSILAVTRGVHAVVGGESLVPEKAAILGACQSITLECPGVTCRALDLGEEPDAARLVDELGASEPVIALRGGHRWAPQVEPVRLEASEESPLRGGSHTLITGGLGSIGLEVAACLARGPRARIALVGRSAFPQREAWDQEQDPDVRAQIEQIRSLESLGAEVLIARADVTEPEQMRAALGEAEERFGPLQGLVHAAGADKTMTLLAQTRPEDCRAQLRPKLEGLAVLEELLAERDLDFVVVQSSLSSQLGALGVVGYVAAHHLLDAFVTGHNQRHPARPWTRVNWDNWLTWKEPEFAHSEGQDAFFMTSQEGEQAFLRVLALPGGTELAVSTGDLQARIERWAVGGAAEAAAAGADLHARPQLASDYAAPETAQERALVDAWGEVLGIGDIGVNDNFFELGGDSVLGLQVVAKVSAAGLRITPGQIFEHPTIAALARACEAGGPVEAEQGRVTGPAPLLPIQRWFFEAGYPDPQHFNLPMLFEVPASASADAIGETLAAVVEHHDALRLRYRMSDAGVEQFHAEGPAEVSLDEVDLSGTPEPERDAAMTAHATGLHTSLDLEQGPLMRAAIFRFDDGQPSQVLWVIHHLLVDVVSWRVLIEDFNAALALREAGEPVALPPKTTSFQRWAEALAEHARSDVVGAELDHWLAIADGAPAPLPRDHQDGADDLASARTVSSSLGEGQTRALLHDSHKAYGTRVDEVLLAAWSRACSQWTGGEVVLIDLEGHGREDVVEDIDLSRTVGWLTALYPVSLHVAAAGGPADLLKGIKEELRSIPARGIGFGLLRHLRDDPQVEQALSALPSPEVSFLYLGQFDGLSQETRVRLLDEVSGSPTGPSAPRGHLLEVTSYVIGGTLQVGVTYSANRHEQATIEALTRSFLAELEGLVEHCLDPSAGGHTPSDFPAARVSQEDLDTLLSKIKGNGGSR